MNRVIKFRVPHYRGNDFKFFSYWGRVDHKGNPSDDCFTSPSTSNVSPKQDEQFIGLTDKNGKEIYEGDILNIENSDPEENGANDVVTLCKWDAGIFILEDNAGGHWTRQLFHQPNRITIIGNIHENPELLTNKT